MANALESASLIMVPSGYEDGTLGSLKPTDGSGDFTFSRGSDISATRVNSDGYIEKGYENLLLQSNQFDTTWTTSGTSVTSGQSGYDGSNDAWLLTNNNDQFPRIELSATLSGVSTYSVYAKAGTNSFCQLRIFGNLNTDVWFDLSTGLSIYSTGSGLIDINSENIGNGWYRLSLSVNVNVTGVRIYSAESFPIYGLGSIYIQDAMLNQGLVAYPYTETTTAPVAGGILEDMPRLDYSNGSCPALLLEPQRTNLVPSSEYLLSIPWNSNTLTFNWETSIINLEGYYGTQEAIGIGAAVYNNMASGVNIGDKLCYSIWAKSSSNANFKFGGLYGGEHATFNVSTGTLVAQGSRLDSYEVIDYGNGWRRYIIVISYSGAGGNKAYGHIEWNDASEPIYLYGFQLEQDATYETSYIPTYGVSQTRLKDVCLGAGDASTFNSAEGVLYAEIATLANDGTRSITLSDGGNNNSIYISYNTNGRLDVNLRSGGIYQVIFNYTGVTNPSEINKIAFKYKQNDFALWVNGVKVDTDSSGITPIALDRLNLSVTNAIADFFFGNINQVLYFPTALTDSECIELTTI